MAGTGRGSPLRLADLLASLSLVADLGFGLPHEQSMRSCLVSTGLARRLGLADSDVADVFFTALLEHIGCSGYAHEAAERYGDEMVVNAAAARTNTADPRDVFRTFLPAVAAGRSPVGWARLVLMELTTGARAGHSFATAACEVGRATARRLGLSEGVQRAIHEVYEQWDGGGAAQGLRADAVSLAARVVQVGSVGALFERIGGAQEAASAVRRRAGSLLDPSIAETFASHTDTLLADAGADDVHAAVLEAEPGPVLLIPASRLPAVAEAFADVADLKSPYLLGHSAGVGALVRNAGERLGLAAEAVEDLHLAGLLHDLGRVGVSDAVWERPGPLGAAQWEQVRLHAYHSERILARSTALRPVAEIAGMHHERLDGSGYHRGARGASIGRAARILAAADAYQAMTQARPHRPAHEPEVAAARLRDDVRAGLHDADAAEAVLEAAGHPRDTVRRTLPGGLSEREVDVLAALARGLTNREIAARFSISPRTAEHHVQHIYDKIGVSSRAAAALFAMEHRLLG